MIKNVFFLLTALVLTPSWCRAQDDMYFTPTKEMVKKKKVQREKERNDYYSGINKSDDEYNRRTQCRKFVPYSVSDSLLYSADSIASDIISFSVGDGTYDEKVRVDTVYKYVIVDDDDYAYCKRLSRFDDFYWWHNFYTPYTCINPLRWYARWYDPWYDPWFNPWHCGYAYPYYSGWYYSGWYDPWFAFGWYDPWFYRPYYYPVYQYGGGGSTAHNRFYAGTRNHRYVRTETTSGNRSYDIAKRNGDATTRHRGIGYRNNTVRNYGDSYRRDYNTQSTRNSYSGNFNSSHSTSSGSSFSGGHSRGFSGGSGGGSFGGGRRR